MIRYFNIFVLAIYMFIAISFEVFCLRSISESFIDKSRTIIAKLKWNNTYKPVIVIVIDSIIVSCFVVYLLGLFLLYVFEQ